MQIPRLILLSALGLIASTHAYYDRHDLYARDELSGPEFQLFARHDGEYHDLFNREAGDDDMVLIPRSLAERISDILAKRGDDKPKKPKLVRCDCNKAVRVGSKCPNCGKQH